MVRPMLAVKADLSKLIYPVYASPKINGMRAIVKDGVVYSRSMKPIPNRFIQSSLGWAAYEGLDGEITIGCGHDEGTLRRTVSGLMSVEGKPAFIYHVFDVWNATHLIYRQRLTRIPYSITDSKVCVLEWCLLDSLKEINSFEEQCLVRGYEGIILRSPTSLYKYGRSTVKEACLLKVKRFVDGEAVIIGAEELMHNANPTFINELGYEAHSHMSEGKVGLSILGALIVRDLETNVEFKIGTGFSHEERVKIWTSISTFLEGKYENRIVKYKHFPKGVKDKPLNPVFLGFRPEEDFCCGYNE